MKAGVSKIAVFDFFSGCGGSSAGFQKAGLDIVFALDIYHDAARTYRHNFPGVSFCEKPIDELQEEDIKPAFDASNNMLKLFCGCAPCQPFTKQKTYKKKKDQRAPLLREFGDIVGKYKPHLVFVENVPGLQKVQGKYGPLKDFCKKLKKLGYIYDTKVVAAQNYGVAQVRRRFILLASRLGRIDIPEPTHGPGRGYPYVTVFDVIHDLPQIKHGEEHSDSDSYPNHRAARLSPLNFRRIRSTAQKGRKDWPEELLPDCYRKEINGKRYTGHSDCYTRLSWNEPAPGLTTRCISYSNGRFGHPSQDRAISIREAARIQGFDDKFIFTGSLNSMARQIGNAVPVNMAQILGEYILTHATGEHT